VSIDEQISALTAQFDEWLVDFETKLHSGDETAEIKTWLAGVKLLKQFDDLTRRGLTMLAALLDSADPAPESERINALLRGFECAAKLEVLSSDVQDIDGARRIDRVMDDIVVALATIGPGRSLLVPLLEHEDARIRAFAGRYLIDLIPDRVIPILEKIDKEAADSYAHWVLLTWELERRGRFNALEDRVARG
jgi:hypothetical protein